MRISELNPEKKHLLLVASSPRSLVNFRGPLIRDVVSAGHRVSVCAPDITTDIRDQLLEMGANVYDTPMQRNGTGIFSDLRYGARLKKLMRVLRPDIVLTYTIKPNIWGAFAAHKYRIRSVAMVTGLGYAFTDGGSRGLKQRFVHIAARLLYRAATKQNSKILFQNRDDPKDFIRMGCLKDSAKVAIIDGSGVDMQHYERSPLPDKPVFLMVARLLQNKGIVEYGEASLRILRKHPEARCLLVGPFDEGPDMVARSKLKRWVDGGLEYLGPLEDVRAALLEARIFVLPSYREGTPRSVLEAMATGRAIITSDTPGCRETVRDGENGFLVPIRNVDALVEAMECAIIRPALIEEMGAASWHIARARYEVGLVNRTIIRHLGL